MLNTPEIQTQRLFKKRYPIFKYLNVAKTLNTKPNSYGAIEPVFNSLSDPENELSNLCCVLAHLNMASSKRIGYPYHILTSVFLNEHQRHVADLDWCPKATENTSDNYGHYTVASVTKLLKSANGVYPRYGMLRVLNPQKPTNEWEDATDTTRYESFHKLSDYYAPTLSTPYTNIDRKSRQPNYQPTRWDLDLKSYKNLVMANVSASDLTHDEYYSKAPARHVNGDLVTSLPHYETLKGLMYQNLRYLVASGIFSNLKKVMEFNNLAYLPTLTSYLDLKISSRDIPFLHDFMYHYVMSSSLVTLNTYAIDLRLNITPIADSQTRDAKFGKVQEVEVVGYVRDILALIGKFVNRPWHHRGSGVDYKMLGVCYDVPKFRSPNSPVLKVIYYNPHNFNIYVKTMSNWAEKFS